MDADLRQRREPIRSKALRNAARGQRCTLNFPSICCYDAETVVLAHIRDETFGMGRKADDTSGVHACGKCHTALDQSTHGLPDGVLFRLILRAYQRTIRRLVLMGEMAITHDRRRDPAAAKKPAKRKASRPIPKAETKWPSRKMESRNDLRRST